MAKKESNSFDPTKVMVAVINWNASDGEMDRYNVSEFVAKAFYEYQKKIFARSQSSKCRNQEELHKQIQELKSHIVNASYMWILDYKESSFDASFSLDGMCSNVYDVETVDDSTVYLKKSKIKIPFSPERLNLDSVPCSAECDLITFMPLENLIWETLENDELNPTPVMYFKKIKGLENCFANKNALALLDSDSSTVSRYTTYKKFKESVENRTMTFISPNRWEDPFEKIYFGSSIRFKSSIEEKEPPQVFCLCFTKSRYENSVALWKNFKNNEKERLVRIEFNFKKLLYQLSSLLAKRHMKLYVSFVEYSLNSKSIKDESVFAKKILEDVGIVDSYDTDMLYLAMLSYKRRAFRFEKEIRFFIVPENGQLKKDDYKYGIYELKEFGYLGLVEKVWLEPVRHPFGWVTEDIAKEELEFFSIKESKIYNHRKQKGVVIFPIKRKE